MKTASPEQTAADAEVGSQNGSQNGKAEQGESAEDTDDGMGDLEAEMMAEFEKGEWDENGDQS